MLLDKMRTYSAKPSQIQNNWLLIDASDLVVGRLASFIAMRLRGKHKTTFTPHMNCGDHVVVINAEKISFTGKKFKDKLYRHHTGYPGGLKERTANFVLNKKPEEILKMAVKRMITRSPLGRVQMGMLHVYAGPTHRHEAQQPKMINFAELNRKNSRAVEQVSNS